VKLEDSLLKGFALRYEALGWSVLPVKLASKDPAVPWKELQSRRMTPEEIERYPWRNVGVITGSISGICVIDEDSLDTLDEAERAETDAFLSRLPATATSVTGKGRHLYYRMPENLVEGQQRPVPTKVRFLPGLDCRGEGGYALAPPSIHPNGHVYVWEEEPESNLAELPLWAVETISASAVPTPLWKDGANGSEEGKRNQTAASVIGKMLRGQPREFHPALWEAVKKWNESNKPPLEEQELRAVFESIIRREGNRPVEPVLVERAEKKVGYHINELLTTHIETLPQAIEGVLPSGLVTIAGKPKVGKSRMALQFALSVAVGLPPWQPLATAAYGVNARTERGKVLFLGLEDGAARLKQRTEALLRNKAFDGDVMFYTDFPLLFNGGVQELAKEIEKDASIRLIVIDTFTAFVTGKNSTSAARGENAFNAEYRVTRPLLDIVRGKPITILLVQHARKDVVGALDPFDSVSGTLGTSAVADATMVMFQRHHKGSPPQTWLYGRGRDIDLFELPLLSRGPVWAIGKDQKEGT
jgi:hypothetical protein